MVWGLCLWNVCGCRRLLVLSRGTGCSLAPELSQQALGTEKWIVLNKRVLAKDGCKYGPILDKRMLIVFQHQYSWTLVTFFVLITENLPNFMVTSEIKTREECYLRKIILLLIYFNLPASPWLFLVIHNFINEKWGGLGRNILIDMFDHYLLSSFSYQYPTRQIFYSSLCRWDNWGLQRPNNLESNV